MDEVDEHLFHSLHIHLDVWQVLSHSTRSSSPARSACSFILLLAESSSDLDVTLLTGCTATVKQAGQVTIDAKRLFDIVRSLPEDEVKVVLDDNYSVQLESGSAKFRLLGLPAEDYPTLPKVDRSKATSVDLEDFKILVQKVVFAITHEETRFQLNGALLKLGGKKMEMVATDGHRMALVNQPMPADAPDLTILIPRKALNEIARLDGGEEGHAALRNLRESPFLRSRRPCPDGEDDGREFPELHGSHLARHE